MLLDKVKHILCISLILLVGVTTLYACKSDAGFFIFGVRPAKGLKFGG